MAKGNQQLQAEAEMARKRNIDAKNKVAEAKNKANTDKLAGTPLTDEERAYCLDIKSKMKNGRRALMPCSVDVLRYSKLKGSMSIGTGVKAEAEE